MIFNENENLQTIGYPFNWAVEYNDGTYQTEFNFDTHEKNDFYSIQQHKISRFGLFGQGMEFYYSEDGGIYLNGRRVDIEYYVDGLVYCLTNNKEKDCITYKQAFTTYNNIQGEQPSFIESINFGYKTLMTNDDGMQFYFQPIVALPLPRYIDDKRKVYMEIKMTSNRSVNGDLVFKANGEIIEKFEAPLEVNKSGVLHWTVK